MRFRLVPRDEGFYVLFNEAAENLAESARLLRDLLDDPSNAEVTVAAINACERRGDELTRTVLRRLNASFVTPFDREDIHALTEEIDDVVDDIHAAADLLVLHGVDEALPEMRDIARILVRAAETNVQLIAKLPSLRNVEGDLEEIDRLESEADHVYRRSVARLFSGEYKAFAVLKWKDVVEALEGSVNAIENISDIVESIVLKHA
jgi:predicted phosphate transport protein (TIGR00153 family)